MNHSPTCPEGAALLKRPRVYVGLKAGETMRADSQERLVLYLQGAMQ